MKYTSNMTLDEIEQYVDYLEGDFREILWRMFQEMEIIIRNEADEAYSRGREDGYEDGRTDGYDEGYAAATHDVEDRYSGWADK